MKKFLAVAALALSATSLSAAALTFGDMYGEPAEASLADRTIVVTPSTKFVNVKHGEVVKIVAGGKEFAWDFDGIEQPFELAKIAPQGAIDHNVRVYIERSEMDGGLGEKRADRARLRRRYRRERGRRPAPGAVLGLRPCRSRHHAPRRRRLDGAARDPRKEAHPGPVPDGARRRRRQGQGPGARRGRLPGQALLVLRAARARALGAAPRGEADQREPEGRRPGDRAAQAQGFPGRQEDRSHHKGIRAARLSRPQCRRCPLPHAHRRACLGHELRQRHQRGRCRDAAPPRQGRRPVRGEADPHHPRRGIRARGTCGVTGRSEGLVQRLGRRRKSLTWQISFLFALISFLVIGAMGFSIDRMLAGELLEANDVLLLGNMGLLRNRLARLGPSETVLTSPHFVGEAGLGYRKLAVAVLDEDRRILRASSEFNIPVSALPEKAIPVEALPERVDEALERELHTRFGGLSRQWTAPDGRWYQVLLARLPLASGANDQPSSVLLALSYDRSLPRELLARYRKGLLETLVAAIRRARLSTMRTAQIPSAPATSTLGIWA